MTTGIRVFACCLLAVGLLGCNETPPPATESVDRPTQSVAPEPKFKLSKEEEVAAAEIPPAEPRRKTIVESLFQAVRHGAAEALDEEEIPK